jgi:hypothetical protein
MRQRGCAPKGGVRQKEVSHVTHGVNADQSAEKLNKSISNRNNVTSKTFVVISNKSGHILF